MPRPSSPPAPLTPITTYAGLLTATHDAPIVRHEVEPELIAPALALGGAVLLLREIQTGAIGAVALGPAQAVAALLATPWREQLGFATARGLTVERTNRPVLEAAGARGIGDWSTMAVDAGSLRHRVLPHGWMVDRLLHRDVAREFVDRHYHTRWVAESPRDEAWVGVRDPDGVLLAAGMAALTPAGLVRLSGITVPVERRGQGLGWSVTEALVELGLGVGPEVVLGVDDDNPTAKGLYAAMGFRVTHEFSSGSLARGQSGSEERAENLRSGSDRKGR